MKHKTLIASAVMLALLSGCSDTTAPEHYEKAQSYIAEQQFSAAMIELKSAIQQQPQVAEYRLALGLLYLKNGESLAAEKELARAIEYGSAVDVAILPWVRSLYLSGQFDKILSTSPANLTENLNDSLSVYKALAELELGDTDAAMAIFDQLSTAADTDLASFAQANLALRSQQFDIAVSQLQSIDPTSILYPEAVYINANIETARNNTAQAITLFEQYLQLTPKSLRAILLLAQAQVKAKLYPAAEKNIQLLLKVLPDQPLANYLKAIVLIEKNDFVLAKEHAEKAINNGYKTPQARIIAAIAAVNQNLESQALHHLSAVKDQLHIYPPAQKLYSMLQLRSGEAREAQSMLLDMSQTGQDMQLVAATSFELVKQGDTEAARELMAKYEQQFNLDAQSLTSMGVVKLDIPGQEQAAIRDLERALLLDPSSDKTRVVLAGSYLRLKQYDKAKTIAQELINNPATAVTGYNLNAYIALLQKDPTTAKTQLQHAEQLHADNPFTLLMQAAIAADEQDYTTASRLLEICIDKYPLYRPAFTQYYYVKRLQNESNVAIKKAQGMLQASPQDKELRTQLAQIYYAEGNYKQSAELLIEALKLQQELAGQDWMVLINALYQSEQKSLAQQYSQQWHSKQPNDVYAIVTYAKALAQQKNLAQSLDVLNNATQANSVHKALVAMKMLVLTELKKYSEALALFDSMPADLAKSAEMLLHKGRLLQLSGQITPALNTFLESYRLQPNAISTMFIANIYATDRSHKQAVQFMEEHFNKHGSEPTLQVYYANLMMDVDTDKAIQLYADLLGKTPNNIMLLNNYAWLLIEANQLDKAKEYAEKALKQTPDNPDVLDTYGKILLKMNNSQQAITYFEKSLQIRPAHNAVTINYAEALIANGNTDKARQLLLNIKSDVHSELKRRNELLEQVKI
mgnify:CR=1 FL=1